MRLIKILIVIISIVSAFVLLEKTLFSFLKNEIVNYIKVGDIDSRLNVKNGVPPGGISVIDFEKLVPEDISVTSIKLYSNAVHNRVRLKIWRLIGEKYEVVGKSDLLSIKNGINDFDLSTSLFEFESIRAKKGDYLGLYMESSEIDRSSIHRFKGRVYVVGDNDEIPKDTIYKDSLSGFSFEVTGKVTLGDKY